MADDKPSSGIELDKLDLSSLMKPQEPPPGKQADKADKKQTVSAESIDFDASEADTAIVRLEDGFPQQVGSATASPRWGLILGIPLFIFSVALITIGFWQLSIWPFSTTDYESKGPPYSLGYKVRLSAEDLSNSLWDLDQTSSKISTKAKIARAIRAIDKTKYLLKIYIRNIEVYGNYVHANNRNLRQRGLKDFIDLDSIYHADLVTHYCKSLKDYLEEYKLFLSYYEKHWEAISAGRQPQRQTYELFNMRHKKQQNTFNAAAYKYNELIQVALAGNSNFKGFLPQLGDDSNGWKTLLNQPKKR